MTRRKKAPPRKDDESLLEYASFRATRWVGSTTSLILHTILFVVSFVLYFFGLDLDRILLILTTAVSLEAIYLSIFIQMSVNRQTKQLREVSRDVEDIAEDVEDIAEDVEDIQEDIDEIQEDVEDIQEDVEDIQEEEEEEEEEEDIETEILNRIEASLRELGKEVAEMKRQHNSGDSGPKDLLRE